MKNLMRRTVALMLMACLLLSVMAPAALATDAANFAPTLDGSSYVYTWESDLAANSNNPTSGYFGNFAAYAGSATGVYKCNPTYLQFSEGYKNHYFALRFNVPVSGTYDIALNMTGTGRVLEFFIVPVSAMTAANGATNTAYVNGLTGGHEVTASATDTEMLNNVTFGEAGDWLLVCRMPEEGTASNQVRFTGMTMTPNAASDIAEVTTKYDFAGVASATVESGKASLLSSKNLEDTNFSYYAASKDLYLDNGKYGTSSNAGTNPGLCLVGVVGDWAAVKLANPGEGKHTVSFGKPGKEGNNSRGMEIYLVQETVLDAKLTELQNTDPSKTSKDAVQAVLDAKTQTAVTTLDLRTQAGDWTVDFTFEGTDDYVAIFFIAEDKNDAVTTNVNTYLRIADLVVTKNYNDLNKAVSMNNGKNTTVKLTDNVDMSGAALNVGNGATLDLNGKTLNADLNITDGSLEDSSNGTGSVSAVTNVAKDNGAVLIKESNGVIRAYNYTAKQNGYKSNTKADPEDASKTIDTLEFWFDADFAEAVYQKLTEENGITINAELKLNGEAVGIVDLDTAVENWITNKGIINGTDNAGLCIEITGVETLEEGDTITVTPILEDNYGTSAFGDAIEYTAPAAAAE